MRKVNSSSSFLWLGMLCLVALSCTPNNNVIDASETRSLDNFAAGKTVTVNSCSGDQDLDSRWDDGNRIIFGAQIADKLTADVKARYRDQVKTYLSSIPLVMQKAYLDFGGVIVMNDNAWERCTAATSSSTSGQHTAESRRVIESCMLYLTADDPKDAESLQQSEFAADASQKDSFLAIYHQVDPADVNAPAVAPESAGNEVARNIDRNEMRILHGGVRVMGLAFGQFFSRVSVNSNERELRNGVKFEFDPAEQTQISAGKLELANQFLLDVAVSEEFDLATVESFLGAGAAQKIRDYLFDGGSLKAKFVEDPASANPLAALSLDGVQQARFEDYVFGEAFDSAKCSDESRAILAEKFSHSERSFAKLDRQVLAQAELISLVSDADASTVERGAKSGAVGGGSDRLALQGFYGPIGYGTAADAGVGCAGCKYGDCANCNCPSCQAMAMARTTAAARGATTGVCAGCTGADCQSCAAARSLRSADFSSGRYFPPQAGYSPYSSASQYGYTYEPYSYRMTMLS